MMGSAIHIHVNAEGRDVVIVVPVSEEEAESGVWYTRGMPLRFTFRGSAAHVFDKETGRNLELPPEGPEPSAAEPAPDPPAGKAPLEKPAEKQEEPVPAGPGESRAVGDPFQDD